MEFVGVRGLFHLVVDVDSGKIAGHEAIVSRLLHIENAPEIRRRGADDCPAGLDHQLCARGVAYRRKQARDNGCVALVRADVFRAAAVKTTADVDEVKFIEFKLADHLGGVARKRLVHAERATPRGHVHVQTRDTHATPQRPHARNRPRQLTVLAAETEPAARSARHGLAGTGGLQIEVHAQSDVRGKITVCGELLQPMISRHESTLTIEPSVSA